MTAAVRARDQHWHVPAVTPPPPHSTVESVDLELKALAKVLSDPTTTREERAIIRVHIDGVLDDRLVLMKAAKAKAKSRRGL